MPVDLIINDHLTIPARLLRISVARSGGPGGQHVNTSDTKVHLFFDLAGFTSLSPGARARVRAARPNGFNANDELQITADVHRSRHANEEEARKRLAALILSNLMPPKRRRPTKPSRRAKQRRLEGKKQRGATKKGRGKVSRWD